LAAVAVRIQGVAAGDPLWRKILWRPLRAPCTVGCFPHGQAAAFLWYRYPDNSSGIGEEPVANRDIMPACFTQNVDAQTNTPQSFAWAASQERANRTKLIKESAARAE